jgi:gamma-glutamyltranspeptidase/glutathione hydrolase/leukotriene-C4 hydrolase
MNYTVKVLPALEGTYRGRKVYTTHPPSSGAALLHMLNLVEHFDLEAEGMTPLNTHRIVEVMKCRFHKISEHPGH